MRGQKISQVRASAREHMQGRPAMGRVLARPVFLFFAVIPCLVQAGYVPEAGEYALTGQLPGDQGRPSLALDAASGLAVWQDNATDGDGLGISAVRLDGNLSPVFSAFRVNLQGVGDQQNPAARMLPNGGTAIVWQGGVQGREQIYARFLSAQGTWTGGDVLVNTLSEDVNTQPDLAARNNSSAVVVWTRYDQDGPNGRDVYARRLSSVGGLVGAEFRVNQTLASHQMNPRVAVLSDGTTAIVVWVSQNQNRSGSSDIYARKFGLTGTPLTGEFMVNTSTNVCVNPAVSADASGGFVVTWEEKSRTAPQTDSRDIFGRVFSGAGSAGLSYRINSTVYGDQYEPRVASRGSDHLVVWTSLGQDGSQEGVYGRFLDSTGLPLDQEFRVNSLTGGMQIHPSVAAGVSNRLAVVWSTYVGAGNGFDLRAQRYAPYAEPLTPPDPPFVSPASSTSISVTWPLLAGFDVAHYEVYADGAVSPSQVTTNNWWTMTNLAPVSTHSFRLAYQLVDGRRSPLSTAVQATTYDVYPEGGIPTEWLKTYWGPYYWNWPPPTVDSDGDGASNGNEFLAGTNPTDPGSVLRTRLAKTVQGFFLSWNTVPGQVYQVQTSSTGGAWGPLGMPRFAAGVTDSVLVDAASSAFFRVVMVR